MSPVDFKKWPCRPVEFRGQGPQSRDMNEKGKEFIFYNKPYMPSAGIHGPLHMVCALSHVPAPTLALDLHAHTHSCTACCWGGGVHVLKCILLIPFE